MFRAVEMFAWVVQQKPHIQTRKDNTKNKNQKQKQNLVLCGSTYMIHKTSGRNAIFLDLKRGRTRIRSSIPHDWRGLSFLLLYLVATRLPRWATPPPCSPNTTSKKSRSTATTLVSCPMPSFFSVSFWFLHVDRSRALIRLFVCCCFCTRVSFFNIKIGFLVSQQEIVSLYHRFCQLDRNSSGFIPGDEFLSVPEFAVNPLSQVCCYSFGA